MTLSIPLGRRSFVLGGAAALGALGAPHKARAQATSPHFFLQVLVTGGLDPTYLFDARPLALTRAGLQQNYLGKEPTPWVGANGQQTLVAEPAEALRPFQADLAVLNGVVMSTSFDGHDQNTNLLLTGNPFVCRGCGIIGH